MITKFVVLLEKVFDLPPCLFMVISSTVHLGPKHAEKKKKTKNRFYITLQEQR